MSPRLYAAWIVFGACDGEGDGEVPGSDTGEGDTDTDTDTDADTDTDTDADADTDPLGCVDAELGDALPLTVPGATASGDNDRAGSCGGANAPEAVFLFTAPEDGTYVVDTVGSNYDTVLVAFESCTGAELACDDDGSGDLQARLRLDLTAGQQVLLQVDGYDQNGDGDFVLNLAHPQSAETTCTDGSDEDLDLAVDCLDPDCDGDDACAPTCPDRVIEALPDVYLGSTLGLPDEHASYCEGPGVPSSDESVSFTPAADGRYVFALETPYDGVMSFQSACGGYELGCVDDEGPGVEAIALDLLAGDEITLVVGGYLGAAGDYRLEVFEVETSEIRCDDGLDDDYNFIVDCLDEACALDAACPEDCENAADDDGDLAIDCADTRCAPTAGCVAPCPEIELGSGVPIEVEGSTLGLSDDWSSPCDQGIASDFTYGFTAPTAGQYTFDTVGSTYDTVLSLLDGCGGPVLDCNDDGYGTDSVLTVQLAAGQQVIVVVDGWEQTSGAYTLRIQ